MIPVPTPPERPIGPQSLRERVIVNEQHTPYDDHEGSGPLGPEDPGHQWPPGFPHSQIDGLVDRLRHGRTSDPQEAARLLQLVAREAQRLRSAVVRLSVARLSAAEREAAGIVAEAQARADEIRSMALHTVDHRLDEAERLMTAMRRAFLVEHSLAGNTTYTPDQFDDTWAEEFWPAYAATMADDDEADGAPEEEGP